MTSPKRRDIISLVFTCLWLPNRQWIDLVTVLAVIHIFFRTPVLRKFDITFSYKHCNFSRDCLLAWEDTEGLHRELHTIPYNFVIRNCMEPSRRLFFISLGAADFVTYDQREVFFPTPFCQENVIIWKQTRHDRVGRPKPAKIKGFSSSISEVSFVSIWSK